MSNALIPKTNSVVGSPTAPTAGALATGELAENKYTGRLYIEKEDGLVVDAAYVQLTGDVTGTTTAPTSNLDGGTVPTIVGSLRGVSLTTTAPAALQTLVYSTTEAKLIYGSPSASSIAGYPLSSVAPTTGQVLQFQTNTDGVQRWTPATIPIVRAWASISVEAKTGKSYTRSTNTVTVTYTSHGYSTGDIIQVTSATDSGINQSGITITVVDANTFTFTTSATGANGTLTIRNRIRVGSLNFTSISSVAVGEHNLTMTGTIPTPYHASVTNTVYSSGAYLYTVDYVNSTTTTLNIETVSTAFDVDYLTVSVLG